MTEAVLWEPLAEHKVRCRLCAHQCLIKPGKAGLCGVRQNRDGDLLTLVYGRTISAAVDPIEKKPLFHFLPGTQSLSIATVGCNFSCDFCQNHEISQMVRDHGQINGQDFPPSEVVRRALQVGAASISYTYTEPTIFFEYALDTARAATPAGLKNVFVTNGYMSEQALDLIGQNLHAANVDLKAFTDDFYKTHCGARLEPVKASITKMVASGIWVEVTTLLIPGENDHPDQIRAMAEWLANLSPEIPWHLSRFRPTYRLTGHPATPPETVRRAREIGLAAGLKYVYTGNLWGDDGGNSYCAQCGRSIIERSGFSITANHLIGGRCPGCSSPMSGVWE